MPDPTQRTIAKICDDLHIAKIKDLWKEVDDGYLPSNELLNRSFFKIEDIDWLLDQVDCVGFRPILIQGEVLLFGIRDIKKSNEFAAMNATAGLVTVSNPEALLGPGEEYKVIMYENEDRVLRTV